MEKELASLILPEGILTYFDVSAVEKEADSYSISLAEKGLFSGEFGHDKLISKGFYDTVTIKDFPIRGKACYLKVKRRRWLNESTNLVVSRDWNLVARGTRMTQEFASFLKALH